MNRNHYSLYKLTFPDGSIYIGATGKKPRERWRGGEGYKSNKSVYPRIILFGWEQVKKEVLFSKLTYEQAVNEEQKLIAKMINDNEFLLNKTKGGDGVLSTREKRQRNIPSHSLSERKVICLKTQKIYNSIAEAEQETGIDSTSISHVCSKKSKSAGGFTWEYVDPEKTKRKKSYKKTSVICIETGKVYQSIFEAIEELYPEREDHEIANAKQMILHVCKGNKHNKTALGYHWAFADKCLREEAEEKRKQYKRKNPIRKVRCIDTGEVFESCSFLEKKYGVGKSNFHLCCQGKIATVVGLRWEYADKEFNSAFQEAKLLRGEPIEKKYPCCIETGEIYENTSLAAQGIGLKSGSHISQCCTGKRKICGGYHWKYVSKEEYEEYKNRTAVAESINTALDNWGC